MSPTHSTHVRGFTLIELILVVSIITVIAAIGIPNLLSSRVTANETAAIATLKAVVSAEAQAATRNCVDVDTDGRGEYLYLAELSGTVDLRGTAAPLAPALVSVSLGNVASSYVNKAGYMYAVFLPDSAGAGVVEDLLGGKAVATDVDANLCEAYWVAYAWPASFGSSGRRAFMVNDGGAVLQTNNDAQQYDGFTTPPLPDAAYSAASDMTSPISIGGQPAPAADGGVWLAVN